MQKSTELQVLNVKNLTLNSCNEINISSFNINAFHHGNDPETANRIKITNGLVEVEMLPSKGFSLSQAWINGKPLFWEAPMELPDTETIDLWSDEICINGKPALGFTYLKTFIAGVELLGMRNWGMPTSVDGKFYPLHGEASNIPVTEVQFMVDGNICAAQANFIYRTFDGDNNIPWYERGEAIFNVTRKLFLYKDSLEIRIKDTIENISESVQTPDWGYHVTFRPEPGAKYLVAARKAEYRGGGSLPQNYDLWKPSPHPTQRIEDGIIYKDLQKPDNADFCHSLLLYPDGSGISVKTPDSPYFQTWFCAGGAGSDEFTWKNGNPLLKRNWDGIGIEFGSSSLDHDGNTDTSVKPEPELSLGETRKVTFSFLAVSPKEATKIKESIIQPV